MRQLIWGAGAIGGTLGAYLAVAGHDITLVDVDAQHVAAINAAGLRITGPIAEFTAPPRRVRRARPAPLWAFTPDTLAGEWDTIVLATKAQHTADATRALLPHLSPTGCIVSAQNGLNELVIAELAGQERTVGAFVNFGADYIEPGVIHYGGRGALVLGELDGRITPRLEAIRRAWLDFDAPKGNDPKCRGVTQNIWGYLWGKEAYGAMLFATALTDDPIADALARPAYRDLYIALAREILTVCRARGVTPEAFDGFDPTAYVEAGPAPAQTQPGLAQRNLDELVAFNRRSAKTHSGIWRDLAVRKRRTEVDAQIGIIVTLGRQAGVPTPLTARLVELIHDIEEGRRSQSLATLDELRALRPKALLREPV